jgi:hypothetical protein
MIVDSVVEIKGENYVLWHYIDAYKVNESIFATPLKDWERLQKEYEEDMETYCQFSSIFICSYEDMKESIEEGLDEEFGDVE